MNTKALYTLSEVMDMIRNNRVLILGGDEKLLDQLPAGKWIAGTTPYFMGDEGGTFTQDKIYVNDVTGIGVDIKFKQYDTSSIDAITADEFENGFTFLIIPFLQPIHFQYGLHSMGYTDIYKNPIFGWVAGMKFEDFGKALAYTYVEGKKSSQHGVAVHIALPDNQVARLEIINVYEQGNGDAILFPKTEVAKGFGSRCIVNGKEEDLFQYLTDHGVEESLPLVANLNGAKLSASAIWNREAKIAHLVCSVLEDTVYKVATKNDIDYQVKFIEALKKDENNKIILSLNCLFNYVNFGLQGKKIGNITGLVTYGEIGYHLLNNTFVYMVIDQN